MVWGICAALGSSFSRAILNILDRNIFGHKHAGVVFVNFANNFLPLVLILPPAVLSSDSQSIISALSDIHNLLLAGLIQLTAYAFSLTFRELTIPQVIVFSKLPDLFIPIGIYMVSRIWSPVDFAFSTLTTLVCLPLLFQRPRESRIYKRSWWVLAFLMSAVVLRGVFSGALVQGKEGPGDWLLVTMATLWWRFIWSLIVMIGAFITRNGLIWTSPGVLLLLGRAGITLAVQALYIVALAKGPITAVWPIINSTALFATVFSSAFFQEHPTGRELIAILGVTGLTVARMFYK